MTEAIQLHTTATPPPPPGKSQASRVSPITDMEPLLHDLRDEIGLLGHVSSSSNEIEPSEICLIHGHLLDLHSGLSDLWDTAWEEQKARQSESRTTRETMRLGKAACPPASRTPAPTEGNADAELISLCDRLVAINAVEGVLCDAIEDDREREKAGKPLAAEWNKIHARLLEIGRPKTQAGAAAAARAAPLNVNINSDGSPMSGELGMWLCLAVCAYLTDSPAPFWRGTGDLPRCLT